MDTKRLVSAQDADITIQSSDGIIFKLHRHNLATHTDAFPGTELDLDTHGDIVHLTEPGCVLEIVFEYVYPRKQPKLNNIDFEILMSVAEAVEKYNVFSAMNTCEVRLSEILPEHAAEILVHAIKHDYPELIDKAAIHISRIPILELVGILPTHCIVPLVRTLGLLGRL
ncbi:hypothetical protein CPB84DRAFT_1695834 [Gymnopilus junonius]|uniref:BTB domain-containing protein n=1 Tax=Gymnopilus junonius TaxID=109634 RepID=A0A9P5N8Y0_GYMJU|nr:hypothetical protein CPB84DRAFT_1695834 [Gymnopilus junonius]